MTDQEIKKFCEDVDKASKILIDSIQEIVNPAFEILNQSLEKFVSDVKEMKWQ